MRTAAARLSVRARGRGLRRAGAVERGARVGARGRAPRRRCGVRGRVHGRPARSDRPAGARAPARGLVVGKPAPERARLERARAAGRPARGRRCVVVTGPARTGDFDLRVPGEAAAVRLAPRRRARAARAAARPRSAPGRHPRARRAAEAAAPGLATASTSAPGSGATASTWSSRRATGASSAAGAGSAATRTASAPGSRGSLAPGLTGERRAVLEGIVLGEDEDLSPGLQDAFRASGLYHLLAVSGSNVMFVAARRARARLGARPAALARPPRRARRDRLVRARRRRPAVRDPGGDRGRARIARLARGAGPRPLALPARRSAAAPGLEPVQPARRRLPALVRGGRGDLPRRPAGRGASSRATRCRSRSPRWSRSRSRAARRPRRSSLLQFGRIPLYSVPANALAAPVVAPLLGSLLRGRAREPGLARGGRR